MIDQQEGLHKNHLDDINSKMAEDQYILAFRQYTRAIISFNLFVKIDEESHNRFYGQEDRRLLYMRQYDKIGLEAATGLEKCLESWPNQGQEQFNAMLSLDLIKGFSTQKSCAQKGAWQVSNQEQAWKQS